MLSSWFRNNSIKSDLGWQEHLLKKKKKTQQQGFCCHEFSTSRLQSGMIYANSQNFSAWYILSFGRGSQIGFYMSNIEKGKLKQVSILNVIDFFKGNGWHDALLQ